MYRASPRAVGGFTLIEIVVFITVAALAATVLVQAYTATARGSATDALFAQGTQLAQQRMEIIVWQRRQMGFAGLTGSNYDPCQLGLWSGPECAPLVVPAGPFVVRSVAPASCGVSCKQVQVSVVDPYGAPVVTLTRQFWND